MNRNNGDMAGKLMVAPPLIFSAFGSYFPKCNSLTGRKIYLFSLDPLRIKKCISEEGPSVRLLCISTVIAIFLKALNPFS